MLLWVWRNKIEAVFSILTHMRIKKTGAKTMNGLISLRNCPRIQRWGLYQRRPRSLSFGGGTTLRIITHNDVIQTTINLTMLN